MMSCSCIKFLVSGGVTGSRVLGSGMLGNKGVAAAMAMDMIKGRKH